MRTGDRGEEAGDRSEEAGDRGDEVSRLRELHHAATDLMSASTVPEVYGTTVETAESVLGFDYCSIWTPGPTGYEVVASSHRECGTVIEFGGGVLERTFEDGESSLTRQMDRNPVASPVDDRYRSGITVPIGEGAVLQAVSTTPNHYDRTDLELAELLAVHAEAAIGTIRSRRTIAEQKRQITRLHDVATEISSCRTHEELYELMRAASEEILGFDWCSLYVLEDGRFVVAMASAASPVEVGEQPFPDGTSKAREVVESGDSLLAEDVTALDGASPTSDRMRSALTVPVGDLGVFNAAHEEPDAFDESDLELAELLAGSVAEGYARIEAERQLHRRKRELERQNERLDRFASTVSHDLRNPLSVATGFAELAEATGDPGDFERLHDAHARMSGMIEELLLLTREDLGTEETEPVSIDDHVHTAWERIETEGAVLETTLPADYEVEAHRGLLSHVLENLLTNAIEHNEPPVTVTVGPLLEEGSRRGFFVEDDGDGIPEPARESAFVHGYSTDHDGTGLGLAIVREFVESHEWVIEAMEGSDGGARFEIVVD